MAVVVVAGTVVVVDGGGVEVAADVDGGVLIGATVDGDVGLPAGTPRPEVHAANARAATTPEAPHR